MRVSTKQAKFSGKMVEISDGSMSLDHNEKCNIISDFSNEFIVISEVGSKDSNSEISSDKWVKWMKNELSAGSWKGEPAYSPFRVKNISCVAKHTPIPTVSPDDIFTNES